MPSDFLPFLSCQSCIFTQWYVFFVYPFKSHSVSLQNCLALKQFGFETVWFWNGFETVWHQKCFTSKLFFVAVKMFCCETVMPNTDNAAQLYAQYRLCCSGLCSIPTMLLRSMPNTDYAAQVYAQYWQCCPSLCSIPTMLLRSMLNTDYAAQV